MIPRLFLIFFLLAINGASVAGSEQTVAARIGNIVVQVPVGLDGPHRTSPNKSTELDVYFSRKDLPPTLLQLTRITISDARSDLNETAKYEAAANFIVGFLQTFSKNVQGWKSSPVEQVRLGDHLAARSKWTGNFHEMPTSGTMYLVVFGKESYCLHTFGRTDVPNVTLESSIRAIEELRVEAQEISSEGAHGRQQ